MLLIFRLAAFIFVSLYGLGTQFLVIPFNANELSIGSHPTLKGLSSLNPALYSAEKNNPSFSISRGSWIGDVSLSSFGYNHYLKNKTFYFGARYSGLSNLEYRVSKPQDEPLAYFSSYGLSIKSGFSFDKDNIKYGVSLSYVSMGIYTEMSSGISLGFGFLVSSIRGLRLGASIQNIGIMSVLENDSPKLPIRLLIGSSKLFALSNFTNTIYTSAELNAVSESFKYKYSFGNKFNWKQLGLLSGISISKKSNYLSLGINLNIKQYQIAYGINIGSQNFGIPHMISLKLDMP